METLNNIFVPYKIAVQLKEIGFDEPCMSYYYNEKLIIDLQENENSNVYLLTDAEFSNLNKHSDCYSAPTYEQVKKWFRQKGIESSLFTGDGYYYYRGSKGDKFLFSGAEDTYEQAREALILKLIKIYKDEKTDI